MNRYSLSLCRHTRNILQSEIQQQKQRNCIAAIYYYLSALSNILPLESFKQKLLLVWSHATSFIAWIYYPLVLCTLETKITLTPFNKKCVKALLDRKGVEDYLASAVRAIESRPVSKQLIFTCTLREINHNLPET